MGEGATVSDDDLGLVAFGPQHVAAHVAGEDELMRHWFGHPGRTDAEGMTEVVAGWAADRETDRRYVFAVEAGGETVGGVEVRRLDGHAGELSWWTYAGHRGRGHATRAVRLLADWALADDGPGFTRLQARVEPGNKDSLRVATRSGMRREGVQRVAPGSGDRPETEEYVVHARLAGDPPVTEPEAFRALLNSFLPRKRAIAQLLVRDHDGRVLLCGLTYKRDWDLPGGVVEVGESPRLAAGREVAEELGLPLTSGGLLLTDWLPPWSGWDDAVCLVFDGGVHDADVLAAARFQAREIRAAEWVTAEQVRERCADFTARRVEAALAAAASGSPSYAESGRPTSSPSEDHRGRITP